MSWGIVASVGASLVGSAMTSSASKKASESQAGAADSASQAQLEQYYQTRDDLAPYRDAGVPASNRLQYLLGLSSSSSGNSMPSSFKLGDLVDESQGDWRPNEWLYQNSPEYKSKWDNFISGHSKEFGVNPNLQRGSDLGKTENFFGSALGTYNDLLSKTRSEAENAASSDPAYGSLARAFTGESLQNDPGYQFGLNQGYQALDRRAAAGGNYFSGAALKAANRYGNDYAGTKFNEAFGRDQTNKNSIFSMLSGVSGQGQNAAAMTGTMGANAVNNAGNYMTQGANASAAGTVGAANAINSGLSSVTNAYQWNSMLGALNKKNTPNSGNPGYAPIYTFGKSEGE